VVFQKSLNNSLT